MAFDGVFVDVVSPFALEEDERAEQKCRDEDGEEGDPDKTPEVDQALVEEGAEAGGAFALVAEESSGDQEEIDQEIQGDSGKGAGVAARRSILQAEQGTSCGGQVKAACESLCGERVIHDGTELGVEADGED